MATKRTRRTGPCLYLLCLALQAAVKKFRQDKECQIKMEKAKEATAKKLEKAKSAGVAADPRDHNQVEKMNSQLPASSEADDTNLDYYHSVQEDVRVVLKHLGASFASQPALPIAEKDENGKGGVQEPWSQEQAGKAISNQGSYICAINLFWLDFVRSSCPGVPLSRKRVEQLADYLFGQGDGYPGFIKKLLEVQVPRVDKMPEQPSALVMISPDEYAHAILAGAARVLPKHKDRWNTILRSVPCCFTNIAEEQLWTAAWNNRNEITQEYESLSRTALQTASEVTLLKQRADKDMCRTLKADEFSEWLKKAGLRKASSQQDMSANLINSALIVGRRLQGDEVVPIREIENRYRTRSCFNDMTKLHGICTKVSPGSIGFVIRSIHDWIMRCKIENEDVSKKALFGDNHTCGLVTLFEFKLNLLDHWVVSVMPRAKILEKDRMAIKKALEHHEQCNRMMWGRDVAWQGSLQRSSQEALQFIED